MLGWEEPGRCERVLAPVMLSLRRPWDLLPREAAGAAFPSRPSLGRCCFDSSGHQLG